MENPSINSDNDRSEQSSSRNERHDHRGNGGNGRYRDTNVGYRGGRGRGFHENGNSRNRGSGSRSRGFHHHQQRSRGIAQHRGPPQPASFQQSKTLVIKDSDNEFLRMLTQANKDSNEKILSQLESNPSSSGVHLSKRILTSIQPSRQSRPADPNHKACPVCLMDSPSLTGELVQAITSCEHVYCFECALRLIFITNKSDCPICRQALSKVTLTRAESLDDVPELKSFLSSTQQSHKQYKKFSKMVFFDAAEGEGIFDLIKQILWFNCTFCKKVPYSFHMDTKNAESYDAISKHLIKHDRNLCDLCFFNLELFPYEYELYTNYEMDQHKSLGSVVGEAQVHHRICYLCPEPGFFFDNDALSAHCKEAHISCYVCTSQAIFFADQPSLLEHVVEKHIICPVCRRTNGQVIGFPSVIELKAHAHVEHINEKIEFDTIAKEALVNLSSLNNRNRGFEMISNCESNMSRREACDRIDDFLRNRYSLERRLNPPQMNPETYMFNFPSMSETTTGTETTTSNGGTASSTNVNNVILFPTKHRFKSTFSTSSSNYVDHFPALGGRSANSGDRPSTSSRQTIATTASSMKHKPQNWQQSKQPQPTTSLSDGKIPIKYVQSNKKSKGKHGKSTQNNQENGSIYDDMIVTDPLKEPQTFGQTKPSNVQLIEQSQITTTFEATSNQSTSQNLKQKLPQKEAFPPLAQPSRSANPAGISGIWSAKGKQFKKLEKEKPKAQPLESQFDGISLNSDFPTIGNGSGPSWQTGCRWVPPKQKKKNKAKIKTIENEEWLRPDNGN